MALPGGRFTLDRGDRTLGPRSTDWMPAGATENVQDLDLGWCPAGRCYFFEDFTGPQRTFTLFGQLVEDDGETVNIDTETGDVSRVSFMVPRAGILTAIQFLGEDALAANDTNYLTFTLVNNGNSGAGTTSMLDATGDANTTKSTGGTAITAEIGRSIAVSATAANLHVAAGDLLTFAATVSGTLANDVNTPAVRLTFATLPDQVVPRTTKTVGLLQAAVVNDTAHGEAIFQLGATNEANVTGCDCGDQMFIPATARPIFQCRLKISGVAANTRAVWGLFDAYAATLDDIANNAWFRWEGNSLNLLAEVDDSTTDDDDNDTGYDLVANTYVLTTIDMTDKGAIRFSVDKTPYLELAGAAFTAADVLQSGVILQKDSGTGEQSITVDYIFCSWDRGS